MSEKQNDKLKMAIKPYNCILKIYIKKISKFYKRLKWKEILSNIICIKNLILTLSVLTIIFIFKKYGFSTGNYILINQILITVSGIFSAIVISILINELSVIKKQRLVLKDKINTLSDKLTTFRRFLYYIVNSDEFWGAREDYNFLAQIYRRYPLINAHTSYNNIHESDLLTLMEDERFSSNKTELFLNLITIVNIPRSHDMQLVEPWHLWKYTLKDCYNYHECFNNIWYFLDHRRAQNLNDNYQSLNILYRNNIIENYILLTGKTINPNTFNSDHVVELGLLFYEKISPELIRSIRAITAKFPKKLLSLIINLIAILLSGVIIPLLIISTNVYFASEATFLCSTITTICFILLIINIVEYSYSSINVY